VTYTPTRDAASKNRIKFQDENCSATLLAFHDTTRKIVQILDVFEHRKYEHLLFHPLRVSTLVLSNFCLRIRKSFIKFSELYSEMVRSLEKTLWPLHNGCTQPMREIKEKSKQYNDNQYKAYGWCVVCMYPSLVLVYHIASTFLHWELCLHLSDILHWGIHKAR
jgi:hypothetical protein